MKLSVLGNSKIVSLFTVHATDASYDVKYAEQLYITLQEEIDKLPCRSEEILLGDYNASVGNDMYENWPDVGDKHGIGGYNKRGLNLFQFCAINDLII